MAMAGCEPPEMATISEPVLRGREPNPFPENSSTAVFLFDGGRGGVEFWCSATLISRRAVVSARHCFADGYPPRLRVGFGTDGESGRGAVALSGRPLLASGSDLALILLAADAPASARPVPILPSGLSLAENDRVSVAGYGLDENRESGDLKATDGTVSGLQRRGGRISTFTVGHFGGQGPCNGDSGGPVYAYRPQGVFLVGAVSGPASGVSRCGNEHVEYAYVPAQLDWIQEHVDLGQVPAGSRQKATARPNDFDGDGVADGAHLRAAPEMLADLAPAQKCLVPPQHSFHFYTLEQHGNFRRVQLEPIQECASWTQAYIYEPNFTIEEAGPAAP
jgi:hypothetical protein